MQCFFTYQNLHRKKLKNHSETDNQSLIFAYQIKMASTQFNLLKQNGNSTTDLTYFRILFALLGIVYLFAGFFLTSSSVTVWLPFSWLAVIPLALLAITFFVPLSSKYLSEMAAGMFLVLTIHLLFFLFKNQPGVYIAFFLIAVILFSNLHITNVIYLLLYNVLVLGALEYILIAGNAGITKPVIMFFSVVLGMLFSFMMQWFRIKNKDAEGKKEKYLQKIFQNTPGALAIFSKTDFKLSDYNIAAESLLNLKNQKSPTLRTLFSLDDYSDAELLRLATAENFNSVHVKTYQQAELALTLISPPEEKIIIAGFTTTDQSQPKKENSFIPGNYFITDTKGRLLASSHDAEDFITVDLDVLKDYFQKFLHDNKVVNDYTQFKINESDPFVFEIFNGDFEGEKAFFWMLVKNISVQNADTIESNLPAENWSQLVIAENNELVSFSPSFLNLIGYSETELAQIDIQQIVHPADSVKWKNLLQQCRNVKKADDTVRFIHRSGEIKFLKSLFSSNGSQTVKIFAEDISDSIRLQKELSLARANVSSVIENTNDLILSLDMNHVVTVINTAGVNFYKLLSGKTLKPGDNYRTVIPADEISSWNDYHQQAMRGKKPIFIRNFEIAGKNITIEFSLNPVYADNQIITGISLFGRDITQRTAYEKELLNAREIAENATAAKSQFLATMSHEIRTPLNGIVGMLELLRMTSLQDKQREYVSTLQLSSENMLNIINDVLDFSKIESDKMELENEPFELRRVIEETFDLLYYRALGKKLELFYNIDETIPAFVMGDSMRLKQVLVNLVGNAIKFTERGHILMNAQLVPAKDDNLEIRFSVKDTGAGISEEQRQRLFKSFQQADVSTYRKYGGTGLGLTISAKLVSLMGGVIDVESTPGSGSEFYFTIKTKAAPVAASRNLKTNLRILRGKKALIFSVSTDFDLHLSDLFNDWNIVHHTVSTLESAKAELTDTTFYDALILDAQMPDYLLFAEELKELIRQSGIPMFAFNARFSSGDVIYGNKLFEAVLPAGVDAIKISTVLIKSFIESSQRYSTTESEEPTFDTALATRFPLRVLIAEDNPVNQMLTVTVLEKLGYKPDVAENGNKVLTQVASTAYDLIFMDVQMPEKDGLETTIELRKSPANSNIIIIAMTAFAMDDDKKKCVDAGMNDYTTKPIRIETVQALIEKWGAEINTKKSQTLNEPAVDRIVINRLKDLAPENDNEFLKNILDLYIKQLDRLKQDISAYHNAGDLENLYKSAHKLKGSSANIGAKLLESACRTVEEKGKNGDSNLIEKDVANLLESAAKTRAEILDILKEY